MATAPLTGSWPILPVSYPKTMGQNKLFILHIASVILLFSVICDICDICDMWYMWDDSKAHRLHYLSVWQVSQQLPWRGKVEMSIPLFTHQQHKEDAFSESLKKGVHLPFQDLTLSRNCQEPHYLSALDHFHFLLSTFKAPPINIYLCQIPSAVLFPLSLPLVLETGENILQFDKLGSQKDERRNKIKESHPIWQIHFDLDLCL